MDCTRMEVNLKDHKLVNANKLCMKQSVRLSERMIILPIFQQNKLRERNKILRSRKDRCKRICFGKSDIEAQLVNNNDSKTHSVNDRKVEPVSTQSTNFTNSSQSFNRNFERPHSDSVLERKHLLRPSLRLHRACSYNDVPKSSEERNCCHSQFGPCKQDENPKVCNLDVDNTPSRSPVIRTTQDKLTALTRQSMFDDVSIESEDTESNPTYNVSENEIHVVKEKPISISDSEEYDTDLEMDENFRKVPKDETNGCICQDVYLKTCRRWQITPQRAFLNGLTERYVSLKNRSLGNDAIAAICTALKDNLRVETLNLESTDIAAAGSRHVAEMLLDNINITHINLSHNDLRLRGAQMLGHVMTVTRYLSHLNLAGNKFDDTCAWFLSSGISTNTTLKCLDLSNNDLEHSSGKLIGKALVMNKHLQTLNISWNKLCGKGSVAIFHALMSCRLDNLLKGHLCSILEGLLHVLDLPEFDSFNTTLENLNISWNGLGYEGSVALSKCLMKNKTLKEIDASNNRIDWLCAPLIADGLKRNSCLSKLKIGINPLTTTGCMELLEAAASKMNKLNLLDASEVSVVGAADLLAAIISRKRQFTFIHGCILPTHDKIGERLDREINPMLKIIEYLRILGLRPLDLMRSFDKTVSFELPREDFVDQIKKIGVKLHPYEIEALANSITAKGHDRNIINYRKLAVTVREVVEAERERKIKEREEWKQIQDYHETILRKGTLDDIQLPKSATHKTRRVEAMSAGILFDPGNTHSQSRLQQVKNAPLSLCAPLGSASRVKIKEKKRTQGKKKKRH